MHWIERTPEQIDEAVHTILHKMPIIQDSVVEFFKGDEKAATGAVRELMEKLVKNFDEVPIGVIVLALFSFLAHFEFETQAMQPLAKPLSTGKGLN